MKKWILVFTAALSLSAFAENSNETQNTAGTQEPFVMEPIFENFRAHCPRGTEPVTKFCWDNVKKTLIRCGVMCRSTDSGKGN